MNLEEIRKKLGPHWFINNILNIDLWEKQQSIIDDIFKYDMVSIKSCHASGKTFMSAAIILAFLYLYEDSIVLSTAPTFRQVKKLIWTDLRKIYAHTNIKLGGDLLPKSPDLYINDKWYALGLSTDEPDRFQGFHAPNILIIVDEANGVYDDIYYAIDGIMASGNAKLLLDGNPTNPEGYFFDSFKASDFKKHTISAFDTPNFRYFDIKPKDFDDNTWKEKRTTPLPRSYLINPYWAYDKYLRWGKDSSLYLSRVLGEFPTEGSNTLIPLSWIEKAMKII